MRKLAVSILLLTTLLGLSACNTIAGVGKDVKAAGAAIEGVGDKKGR